MIERVTVGVIAMFVLVADVSAQPRLTTSTISLSGAVHEAGTLMPSQVSATRVFTVDTTTELRFGIVSQVPVTVEIVAPGLGLVTAATAVSLGVEFDQVILPGLSGNDEDHVQVVFGSSGPAPVSGTYTVNITAAGPVMAAAAFVVTMLPSSELRVGLDVPDAAIALGKMVAITAFVFEDLTPVTNATAVAEVTQDGTSVMSIPLLDNGQGGDSVTGDGLYSGLFIPETLGWHIVVARIEGTTGSGDAFRRTASAELRVFAKSSGLRGDYTASESDVDGDSLIDVLKIGVGLSLGGSGDYDVSLVLEAPNGEALTAHRAVTVGSAQDVVVDVEFYAAEVRDLGSDGPYIVTDARLDELTNEGHSLRDQASGTLAQVNLGLSAFDRPGIELLSDTVNGVGGGDSDQDGIFDTLVVSVGVDLLFGGTYLTSANLADVAGTQVGAKSATPVLGAGRQTIEFAFDGCEIRSSGLPGPYSLSSLFMSTRDGPGVEPLMAKPAGMLDFASEQFCDPCPSDACNYCSPTNASPCVGDCDHDCVVNGDEINSAIDVALGVAAASGCSLADEDMDGAVAATELVHSVNRRVYGCKAADDPAGGGVSAEIVIGSTISFPGGSTVSFVVSVLAGNSKAAGLNVDLLYPSNVMTTPSCSIDERFVDRNAHVLYTNEVESGRLRLLLLDSSGYPSLTFQEGVIAVCETQVRASAPLGEHAITGERNNVSDGSGAEIPSTVAGGIITVADPASPPSCAVNGRRAGAGECVMMALLPALMWIARRRKNTARILQGVVLCCAALLAGSSVEAQRIQAANGKWMLETGGEPSPRVIVRGRGQDHADASAAFRHRRDARRRGKRSWHVSNVVRNGNTVRANVAIVGASFLSIGTVRGKFLPDGTVKGVIMDRRGNEVATVVGRVTRKGLRGKFVATNGETGAWDWQAPKARRRRRGVTN